MVAFVDHRNKVGDAESYPRDASLSTRIHITRRQMLTIDNWLIRRWCLMRTVIKLGGIQE